MKYFICKISILLLLILICINVQLNIFFMDQHAFAKVDNEKDSKDNEEDEDKKDSKDNDIYVDNR